MPRRGARAFGWVVFAHLLHLAKTAVNLCGACSNALEAEEPVLNRETRCG